MSTTEFVLWVEINLWCRAAKRKSSSCLFSIHDEPTDIETQLATETMNAVPTPRLLVGDMVLAAQLLNSASCQKNKSSGGEQTNITRGKSEKFPAMTRNSAKYEAPALP